MLCFCVVSAGHIRVAWINGTDNLADALTKVTIGGNGDGIICFREFCGERFHLPIQFYGSSTVDRGPRISDRGHF
jgi:hypothetical protein